MVTLNLQVLFDAKDKITGPMKVIIGGSQDLSKAFKQTTAELKALQDQQRSVDRFKQTQTALEKTQQTLKGYRQELKELQKIEKSGNTLTDTQIKKMSSLEQGIRRLKSTEASQRNELQAHTQALNKAGFNVDKVAKGVDRLTQEESDLKNKIHQTTMELNKRRDELDKNNESQKRFAKTQAALQKGADFAKKSLALGVVGTAGLGYTLKQYEDAEDAAMGLRVSMMQSGGKVAKEFDSINQLANRLGTKLPGTTADFQNMMTVLVQQGITAKAILGGVGEAAGYLAVQMKMPFDQAAEFAAKMQDATKTREQDMLALMDTIQRSYYLGVDSTNMLSGFAKMSAGMKIIKQEGLEGAKALAPLLVMADQAAMAGESAGNAFSKIFKAMMDTDKIKKALKDSKTGITMNFTNGKGEFGGLENMYKQLEKLKGLSTEKRLPILADMFGNDSENIQALNLLIDKGKAGYDEVVAKMQAQADLQTRVNAQLSTLKNLKDAAGGTFTSLLALFGEQLSPQFKVLIEGFSNVTEKVTTWSKENPQLANTVAKIVAGGILLVGGLSALALGITALLGPIAILKVTLGTLGLGFSAVGAIFSPVGLVILGIVAAVAGAAYLIYRNWEPISGFFIGIWSTIKTAFNGGIRGVTALILNWSPLGLFYSIFAKVLSWFGIDLPKQFTGFGSMIIQGLIDGIKSKFDGLKGVWEKVTSYMPDFMRKRMDIHSPSRVMAGMGGHIVDGIGVGLNQRTPALQTQFNRTLGVFDASPAMPSTPTLKRRFTDSIGITETPVSTTGRFDDRSQTAPKFKRVAAINSPRSISVTNSDNITIHINAGGGGPIRNAANEVRQALAERDRQRNADLRRMLTDRE
ncbi:phage tail tape measure protein [Acinetobacter soli]|uniref:phage tail tape measure protein n=1 Tax=Acinetobacter soli TaxID=487316 RepID=UPI001ABCD304|nr:phage tail tape measure protein [Acinetobacter soli]MBO3672794.1 phage tail tape measure protein [Acinetobacter soli]